jgi:hypothetical protein
MNPTDSFLFIKDVRPQVHAAPTSFNSRKNIYLCRYLALNGSKYFPHSATMDVFLPVCPLFSHLCALIHQVVVSGGCRAPFLIWARRLSGVGGVSICLRNTARPTPLPIPVPCRSPPDTPCLIQ